MLTVKYIDRQGVESIREYFAVVADRTEHDGRPRVVVFDEVPQVNHANHVGIYCDTQDDSSDDRLPGGPVLYVMNRFGATVATYYLRDKRPKPQFVEAA